MEHKHLRNTSKRVVRLYNVEWREVKRKKASTSLPNENRGDVEIAFDVASLSPSFLKALENQYKEAGLDEAQRNAMMSLLYKQLDVNLFLAHMQEPIKED